MEVNLGHGDVVLDGDEIANANFYAVHPEARKLPKFAEMTQNNGHYAVQSQ